MLTDSIYFGVLISLGSYVIGMYLRKKTGWSFMNPLLIAIILVIACLLLTGVSYEDYNRRFKLVELPSHTSNNMSCRAIVSTSGAFEEEL